MRIEVVTAPTSGSGIAFQIDHATGSSTVRGFAFGTDDNVGVNSAINVIDGSGHQIACNHFGLNAAGSAQLGTLEFNMGVLIEFSATGVVIGTDGDGTADLAERNVFGPGGFAVYVNANDSNRISGNFIGLTADGTTRVQAGRIFIRQSSGHNLIGTDENGTSDDLERNYFGTYEGVLLTADGFQPTDNRVVGNTFGFTPAGVPLDITYAVSVDSLDAIETGYEIRKNIIGSAVTGVHVTGAEAGASVLISDNLFGAAPDGSATAYPNTTAILLDGAGSHAVSDNDILNSTGDGISVADTATFAAGSTGNCVINNVAGVANSTGIGVTFESNFWGAGNGPSGSGPGSGDSVSADVDYVPWLDTPPARCNTAPVLDDTTFAVAEDAAVGTLVGTIAAADDGPTVDYSITAGNISGAFAIDTTSGAITTAAALDYETTPSYALTVEATDGVLSDTATVTINVTDVVETPPNTAPVASDGSFTIAEDAAVGSTVGTVAVTDDGPSLAFSITAGDPAGVFAIGATSGGITTAAGLDYETTPQYVLTVLVSDGSLSDTATVTINVTDVVEPSTTPTFDDVPTTHTFFADVEWLAAEGITRGCNPPANDLFCPDASVTRGQMAAFLHRALGGVLTAGGPVVFTDISGSVFTSDIEWLGGVGVTRGCNPPDNDMYCPNAPVTRGQMAAFLVRALGYTAGAGSDRFVDDNGSVFEADIERLAEAGVTLGCNPPDNDMFCPNAPVTRGQMAAFLHRALGT
jgi:hypothetical protein